MWSTLLAACSAFAAVTLARPSEPVHQQQPILKTLGQEIGSPSELAWQAWLLVESKGGISSALDSSNILRRITPKSIFIAPELISCPSGYSTDGRGSCKPDPINIDEAAQKQFFLKRLNAIYGKFGAAYKKKPEQPPQGPLQINIPISALQPAKNPQQPIPVLVQTGNKTQEASVTAAVVVYKLDNQTKKQDEPPFLLGGGPPNKVAEIVVEANDTFAGVVDYKIPARPSPNVTAGVQQQSASTDEKVGNDESSEDSSPTLVLLLSSTKVPPTPPSTTTTTEKAKVRETTAEVTEDARTTEMTTTTLPTTLDESMRFETMQTVAPLLEDVDTTIRTSERPPLTTTRSRDELYERRDQQMTTTTLAPSTVDDETAYTDEDETEETQTPEQESEEQQEEEEYEDEFAEDELLKPGEAGTLLSAKNQELIRSKTHEPSTIPVTITTTTTTIMQQDTTTIPPTVDDIYEAKESTIKAEVTSFTTTQTQTTTDLPPSTIAAVNTVPPIVVEETTAATPRPPQRVKATIQIDPYVAETRRQPTYTTTRVTENPTEPPAFFPQQRQPKPSFTVNDEPPIFFKDNNNLPPEFKDQLLGDRTYVRFPDQRKPPLAQRGYVRFPSDDVNSIHNHQDSLKDLSPFQYSSSSSTKSSVQRWRQQQQKQQKPMLLRFWARMPLVRDLSFYPTTSHGSHNEPIGGPTPQPPTSSRRAAIFKNDA